MASEAVKPVNTETSTSENGNIVLVKVLRSCSSDRDEFTLDLKKTTLNQLRRLVSASSKLSNIPVPDQRLFYMGRELKTSGRRLYTLLNHSEDSNVEWYVIHVHCRTFFINKPKRQPVIDLLDNSDTEIAATTNNNNTTTTTIDLMGDSSDDDVKSNECVVIVPSRRLKRARYEK